MYCEKPPILCVPNLNWQISVNINENISKINARLIKLIE